MQNDVSNPQSQERVDWNLQSENLMLKMRVRSLQEALEYSRNERTTLEAQLKALDGQTHGREQTIVELNQRCLQMQFLFVAASRLLTASTRNEVLGALQDIVANLLGSESAVLFEMNAEGTLLQPAAWWGVDDRQRAPVAVGNGVVGSVAMEAKAFMGDSSEAGMAACIPLRDKARVVGVLAIFSLLPQKSRLEPQDEEVLMLLEEQLGPLLARSQTAAKERPI